MTKSEQKKVNFKTFKKQQEEILNLIPNEVGAGTKPLAFV